ncbi:hypothetical protein [Longimicrobium sp.]|uniref:hypothetical protein n=1 Tax=Longimicrobium sp. TaxID=2029185 RepID=UPI002E333D9C|nr:hypothetical protein [Longimicrobium sp.]HEX6041643.1 hypothetical protein [Longimicrobium sp.]
MNKVMEFDGYTFWIAEDDVLPPRVRVHYAGTWCWIVIGYEDHQPPYVMEWEDMRWTDAGRAVWIVNGCQELLLAHWRRYNAQA